MPTVPLVTAVPVILLAVLAALAGGGAGLMLAEWPLLAGALLAGGAGLGSWAGWRAGLARRPRPATVPVPTPGRRRRR
jgi:hypothetical protein